MLTNDTELTEEDVHITLAALRLMQANLPQLPQEIEQIATNNGEYPLPDPTQLDTLCEFINVNLPKLPDSEA